MGSIFLVISSLIAYAAQCSYPTMSCVDDSGYINDWDAYFGNVQSSYFLSGVVDSVHDNGNEDRRWKMRYCQPLGNTNSFTSTFSLSTTPYDNYWSRDCGSNAAFIGGTSTHDNSKEDRIWTWYCGNLDASKYELSDCSWSTVYVNSWDSQFSYYCPNSGVMRAMQSTHDNDREDRRWAYYCCRIMDVPTPSPTTDPTADPTADPTTDPTSDPTADPTTDPTSDPTADPTFDPTADPTYEPTIEPTADPTGPPTVNPTNKPTRSPTLDGNVGETTAMASTTDSGDDEDDDDEFNSQSGETELMDIIYILAGVSGFLLCCVGFIIFYCVRKKKKEKSNQHQEHMNIVASTSPTSDVGEGVDSNSTFPYATNHTNAVQSVSDLELPPMPPEENEPGVTQQQQQKMAVNVPMVLPLMPGVNPMIGPVVHVTKIDTDGYADDDEYEYYYEDDQEQEHENEDNDNLYGKSTKATADGTEY